MRERLKGDDLICKYYHMCTLNVSHVMYCNINSFMSKLKTKIHILTKRNSQLLYFGPQVSISKFWPLSFIIVQFCPIKF